MTAKEIDFYADQRNLVYEKCNSSESSVQKSVQQLASMFLNDLNSEGKGSNPTAIVKISNKIKS